MGIKCFLIKEVTKAKLSLRRYARRDTACPKNGYHNAQVYIPEQQDIPDNGIISIDENLEGELAEKYKGQWPTKCECGYIFKEEDPKQLFKERLYETIEGWRMTMRDAPAGAMWNNSFYQREWKENVGPDGLSLFVKLPDGTEWCIDSRANNCDSPCKVCGQPYHAHTQTDRGHNYEDARPHKCWVRRGVPPNIHVDKNGVTCGAGAGSIATPGYHGFLHNGELTNA